MCVCICICVCISMYNEYGVVLYMFLYMVCIQFYIPLVYVFLMLYMFICAMLLMFYVYRLCAFVG